MKDILLLVIAVFCVTLGLGASDAEAKRLGGGRSLGLQRDQVIRRDAAPAAPVRPATAPGTTPQPGGASRWLGPIAGLAAGLGLAALASHFGLGEEFGSVLLIMLLAAAGIYLLRMLRAPKIQNPALEYAGGGPARSLGPQPSMPAGPASSAVQGAPGTSIPSGFDTDALLRTAKVNFLRLQAANDAGNVEDIREFSTPEMFAELRLDLQDRGAAPQHTDVVTLNAELLDVSEEAGRYVASVRFSGMIRETEGSAAQGFDEVWHLAKPRQGGGWVIAGIQQAA